MTIIIKRHIQQRSDKTIKKIIRKALKGDKKSYDELYHQLKPYVKSIIIKRIFRINQLDSDILAHDVVSHIFIKLQLYRNRKANFYSWAGQLTLNYIVDHYRRNRYIENDSYLAELGKDLSMEKNTPETKYLNKEKNKLLQEVIDQLPPLKQIVIRLYSEGKSIRSISETIQKSESAITTIIFRIKRDLKQRIAQQDYL